MQGIPPTILKLPLCKEFRLESNRLHTPSYSIHLPSISPEFIVCVLEADPVGNMSRLRSTTKPLPYPPEYLIPPAFYENAFKTLPKPRRVVDSISQLLRPVLEGDIPPNQQAFVSRELSTLLQPAQNRLFLTPESVSSVMSLVSQERLARPQRYGSDSSKHGVATPELNAIVHSQNATLLLAINRSDWKDYTLLPKNNTLPKYPAFYKDNLQALSNGVGYVILLLPLSTHAVARSSYQSLNIEHSLPPTLFYLTPLSLLYSLSFWLDWYPLLATGGIASPFHTSKGVTQFRLRLSSQLLSYKGHDYRSLSRQSQVLTKELYNLVRHRVEERVGMDGTPQKAVKSLHKLPPYYFKESILQICCLHKALICSDFYAIEHTSQNRKRSALRKQIATSIK